MRLHAFVDAENINEKIFWENIKKIRKANKISKIDVFGKEKPSYCAENSCTFTKCFYAKNSADTFMTASIVKALYEEPLLDGIIIFSGDKDFAPAIKAVTDMRKHLILVSSYKSLDEQLEEMGVDNSLIQKIGVKGKEKRNYCFVRLSEQEREKVKHLKMSTIYVKSGIMIYEVPFGNGIDINTFSRILPMDIIKKYYPKSWSLSKILEKNFIKLIDGYLYVDTERICHG